MQTVVDESSGLLSMAGAQTGDDQRVLAQFALSVAAADAYDFGHQRLQDTDGVLVVTFGERLEAAIESNQERARRELAGRFERFQFNDPTLAPGAISCRGRNERVVIVDEMHAGMGKCPRMYSPISRQYGARPGPASSPRRQSREVAVREK